MRTREARPDGAPDLNATERASDRHDRWPPGSSRSGSTGSTPTAGVSPHGRSRGGSLLHPLPRHPRSGAVPARRAGDGAAGPRSPAGIVTPVGRGAQLTHSPAPSVDLAPRHRRSPTSWSPTDAARLLATPSRPRT
ncbi:MAG: hypothetical protein AVDCRST_MAG66-3909 [uncultured Pseudonocardia sp.]|uniref:Uncharacterized protein n=1 Tax=uncultured Pseudonocardia sp. TaxID=211455 RepID=A0A6J4QER9_9PSEU|nr:MAG: hypothetical protein AVDCRST_MAG66-3909 [uncultured Pseudonocardia sp.]